MARAPGEGILRRLLGDEPLSRFEKGAAALVAAGVLVRLLAFLHPVMSWDPAWYLTMARTLLEEGEFTLPWTPEQDYTQHYPPAFPAYLAAFNAVLGHRVWVAQLAAFLAALFLVVVTFACTRDLYGRSRAFAVTAVVATFPFLIESDALFQTETLVVAFYALTIWGILRSLTEPKYILVAGVFAALGYLAKASMGPFFILAGLAGLAWRFAYVRWRVFTDVHYLSAAAIFGTVVLAWASRNVLRHGWPNWETQRFATFVLRELFASPQWPMIVLASALWSFLVLAVFALPWLGGVRESMRRIREEPTSALWLAVVTPVAVAVFFIAAFAHHGDPIKGQSAVRYVIAPLVPLLWIGMRILDLAEPPRRPDPPTAGAGRMKARAWTAAGGVALLAITLALSPVEARLSGGRVLLLYTLLLVGLAVVAASAFLQWTPSERRLAGGAVAWRAAPAPVDARRMASGAVVALLAFAIATFVWIGSFAYTIPAVAAALLPRASERVLAVAAILLGASLAGVTLDTRVEETALDLPEVLPGGGTVAVVGRGEFFYYPLLPDGFRMVTPQADPDVVIVAAGETPPENYTLARTYEPRYVLDIGTALLERIEDAMGIPRATPANPPTHVYVRSG